MSDKLVKHPTYFRDIRHFFEETDLDHMMKKGIDLSTYDALVDRDTKVLLQTEPPNAPMPPEAGRKWSEERWRTFKNWVAAQPPNPLGLPQPAKPKTGKVERIRKDVSKLDVDEIKLLSKAFSGIMDLEIDNPKSYFALASIHWFPDQNRCEHHVDKYHPWHRAYMKLFEDALRSIDGCESVTLPYWDITKPPPKFLFKKPFSGYTFPVDVSPKEKHKAGKSTIRESRKKIIKNVKAFGIPETISKAMSKAVWNDFISFEGPGIVAAHDHGHVAMGESQFDSDVAAFDPIFWFFHANWDRLWWEWQQTMSATTYWTFRSTIRDSTTFLEAGLDDLEPFPETVRETINSHDMGISYELLENPVVAAFENGLVGSLAASKSIRVQTEPTTSIRLKGIDRLKIPGGFKAVLKADGMIVGQRFFFQSSDPEQCENCRKNAIINLDFEVPMNAVLGKKLNAELHLLAKEEGLSSNFPLQSAGSPTLNARLLLEPV